MSRKTWPWVAIAVVACVVCLGAYTWSFTPWVDGLKPSLTGDRASDATCAAAVTPFIENGQPNVTKLLGMTPEERREISEGIEAHMWKSEIPEIKEAATQAVAGMAIAGNSGPGAGLAGLFATAAFIKPMGDLAQACRKHGWSPQAAGLL